jgi:hypothetical protein
MVTELRITSTIDQLDCERAQREADYHEDGADESYYRNHCCSCSGLGTREIWLGLLIDHAVSGVIEDKVDAR